MSIAIEIRRGKGPFWGRAKRLAKAALALHLPVNGMTRPAWRGLYQLHVSVREGWIWLRRFFWNEPLFRSQCASVGPGLRMEELPYLVGQGHIEIGCGVRLSGKSSIAFNNQHFDAPELLIGDGTFIGHQCILRIGRSLRIGRNCLIASGTSIADFDGHPLDASHRRRGESSPQNEIQPVIIGDDVWIGQSAAILKGVTIGDRAVIATRAVVTRNVPSDCVVAGNPARPVRDLSAIAEPSCAAPKALAITAAVTCREAAAEGALNQQIPLVATKFATPSIRNK